MLILVLARSIQLPDARVQLREVRENGFYVYRIPFIRKSEPAAGKRGVANTAGCDNLDGATWFFDWSLNPFCPGVVSYPTFWCVGSVEQPIPQSKVVLTFNEPDKSDQCDTLSENAVEPYHRIVERFPDREIVSPSVAAGLGGWQPALDWLIAWRAAYIAHYGEPPKIDSIAYHWYGWTYTDAVMVTEKFKALAISWDVPSLSLTEFAFLVGDGQNCNSWQFDSVSQDARRFIAYLEQDDMIARYAWFAPRYNPEAWFAFKPAACNAPLFDWGTGKLTRWGELYRGH